MVRILFLIGYVGVVIGLMFEVRVLVVNVWYLV